MNNKTITPKFLFIITTILLVAASRLLPHPDNFTPIAAMALFGAVHFSNKKFAFIIPIAAMFVSDIFIGFHNVMIYVYAGFILTTLIGFLVKRNVRIYSVLTGSALSSVLFFLITNFGVWASGGMKGGVAGLITVYELGIPFFRNTFTGDIIYNTILFGSFYLACLKFPKLSKIENGN